MAEDLISDNLVEDLVFEDMVDSFLAKFLADLDACGDASRPTMHACDTSNSTTYLAPLDIHPLRAISDEEVAALDLMEAQHHLGFNTNSTGPFHSSSGISLNNSSHPPAQVTSNSAQKSPSSVMDTADLHGELNGKLVMGKSNLPSSTHVAVENEDMGPQNSDTIINPTLVQPFSAMAGEEAAQLDFFEAQRPAYSRPINPLPHNPPLLENFVQPPDNPSPAVIIKPGSHLKPHSNNRHTHLQPKS